MSDFPPPDLKDSAGRLRRLVVSIVVGIALGIGAYLVAAIVVAPESEREGAIVVSRQMTASSFVLWIGLLAGVIGFVATLVVQNRFAAKRWPQQQMPNARALR